VTVFVVFSKEDYRKRLRLLRLIYNMNQTQFASFIGIGYKRWSHYERGYPIPREAAWALRKRIPDFSTDWLWFDDTRALSPYFRQRLRDVERWESKEKLAQRAAKRAAKSNGKLPRSNRISATDKPSKRKKGAKSG